MIVSNEEQDCIVYISFWSSLKIHILSFLFGIWILLKRITQRIFKRKESHLQYQRDTPPLCLVDSSLGQHSYVKLKGIKFHYVESGSRDKPLVLFLHGFPDCWISWRHQIPALSNNFRVVALDLKGFGDSDKPMWRRCYRIDILLAELKEFISRLGVSSCILVGHDMGALLGWYMIHCYPEMVEKFISISCPHPNRYWDDLPRSNTFNRSWMQFSQLPYLPESDVLKDDIKIINQCLTHLHKSDKKEDYVEAYKYTFSRKEDWTGPINYFRNLPFVRVSVTDGFQVDVPCLLLFGNKDQFVNLESMVKSTDYIHKFTLKIIDGAGHFPHQEMPEVVNKLLLSFLIVPESPPSTDKSPRKRLVDRMFGAVTNTVKYGNHVFDAVQKRTNDMVYGLPTKARYFGQSPS